MAALGVFVGYLIFFQPQKVEEKTPRVERRLLSNKQCSRTAGPNHLRKETQERRTSTLSMREERMVQSSSHSMP